MSGITKYDSGIFHTMLDFLKGLENARVTLIRFQKTHEDGENDYWSYYFIIKKYPFSETVKHHVKFSGYANKTERTIFELEKTFRETFTYKSLVELAIAILTHDVYDWVLPNGLPEDPDKEIFAKDKWYQNPKDTIEQTVDLFMEMLKTFESISIQKYNTPTWHSEEIFSARLVRSPHCYGEYDSDTLYIIGNTFTTDEIRKTVLAGDGAPLVDFNRVEVANRNEVKIYITKLIADWVDEALRLGSYMEPGKSKEDEIKDILHDMMFWDDRNPKWTAYDSTDKVNAVWLSQYKTKEDRENLFKEIK